MLSAHLAKLLRYAKTVSSSALNAATIRARKEHIPLEQALLASGTVTEEDLYREIARLMGIPFVEMTQQVLNKDVLFIIPEPIANEHRMIPFEKTANAILVATTEPDDLQTIEFIRRKTGLAVKVFLTTPTGIAAALKSYRRSLTAEFEDLTTRATQKTAAETEKDLKQLAENIPIVRIVDSLLEHAMYENASDIHIEPEEKEVVVRYRIDGVLRPMMTLPKAAQEGITARIKILANLKLDEHRLPQDGRFTIETPEFKFSIRVSLLPVYDGEKIVMRLLSETAKALSLEALGLPPDARTLLEQSIQKPHGILYVTGPTGSGKTTTLYSLLAIVNTPRVNVITVEDPVEYRMPGINQSQINPRIGYTFANGLRSILRQDPNVIMVGEIRDTETAEIAANAALTGHLVLSTLHTNDAIGALSRLEDFGIAPFLIAYTTNAIIAQRLVRKICKECATNYPITPTEAEELRTRGITDALLRDLAKEKFIEKGVTLANMTLRKGAGCRSCGNEGYRGRVGIYEALAITPDIGALIARHATTEEIRAHAATQGMRTMFHDGFAKALNGTTTLAEVFRVTKE